VNIKLIILFSAGFFCSIAIAQKTGYNPDLSWPLIEWAGQKWHVKNGYYNPGPKVPNYYSANNVFTHDDGLHLKITKEKDVWYCAELHTKDVVKYGTYIFDMVLNPPIPVDEIDPNITIGTFLYEEKTEKEIDVEFASWGVIDEEKNTEFSIHSPYGPTKNRLFGTHPAANRFRSLISWSPEQIIFQSFMAADTVTDDWLITGLWIYNQSSIKEENFDPTYIPRESDNMKIHINFFIKNATPPINNKEAELIITDFKYIK